MKCAGRIVPSLLLAAVAACPPSVAADGDLNQKPSAVKCAGLSYGTTLAIERLPDWTVKGSFAVGGFNPCQFYSKVTLRNPGGTRDQTGDYPSGGGYNASLATAVAVLPMNYDDGTYSATGWWNVQYETENPQNWLYYPSAGALASKDKSEPIRGFVQITGTAWAPSAINHTSPTNQSTFTVDLIATNNCLGPVGINGLLSAIPANWAWIWAGGASPYALHTNSATTVAGGSPVPSTFLLSLTSGAGSSTIRADASISSLPSGCDIRGPAGGPALQGASLTVNQ